MVLSAKCLTFAERWNASAQEELDAAETLRAQGHWAQVYWHAGFSVEHMLKAIRIKREGLEEWPAGDRGANWHQLEFVADRAGVKEAIRLEGNANTTFQVNWLTVRDWSHHRRYPEDAAPAISRKEALELLRAVSHPPNGIMRWLQQTYNTI